MHLNFALLEFENVEYSLYRIPYIDEDQLRKLRDSHNDTNSFFRDQDYIYHSPMEATGGFYEGEEVTLSIVRDIDITKKLLHHLIFRMILRTNAIMSKFAPIIFYQRDKTNDLLKNHLAPEESSKVGYWKGFKIDSRVMNIGDYPYYGLVLNILYRWKIKISCESVLEMGIALEERYVEIYDEERQEIFKSNRNLIGKVVSHDGEYAIVQKEEEEERYLLSELYLENSYQNRQDLLESFLGQTKANESFNQLASSSQDRVGAKAKHQEIVNFKNWLSNFIFTNNHGFTVKVQDFIHDYDHLWQSITITKPTFSFNSLDTQKDSWHDRGLKTYGPYSKTNFTPSTPKVAIIFREQKRGIVSRFMGKFRDGIPHVAPKGNPPYGQGFANKYRLTGIEIRPYLVEDETIASYDKTIRKLIEEMGEEVDLVFLESCQDYKSLPAETNPYFFTKAKLLKHGIPSQVVLHENMVLPDKNLVYILNSISLAVYAKLGGIPWVTLVEPDVEHELVIGIGNKVFMKDRFSISRRIVGITTLFTGDGRYELSSTSKDVPYEDYLEELKRTLSLNIDKVRKKYNWIKGDTVRLVFHVFKPFNNEEISAIEDMVQDLKNEFEVIFAYLTIAQYHPYLIFDKKQDGVSDIRNRGKLKGIWQPYRTKNTRIDNFQWLLQLTGPYEIKTYRQGMAAPVLVKLHERSSYRDIEYLTRQVFYFSCISWRTFQPASLPVTLEYSTQIAKILGNLRMSGHWDSDLVPSKLKSKAWFL